MFVCLFVFALGDGAKGKQIYGTLHRQIHRCMAYGEGIEERQ